MTSLFTSFRSSDSHSIARKLSIPHFPGYEPWIGIWDITATEFYCVSGRLQYAVSDQNGIAQIGGGTSRQTDTLGKAE